ncbi:Bah domain [Thalictrum thalictroides]|uniref:Bah domain n=1 Tax=Thalictrum thalictroides TaxID=46969 RepID=A0A7J6X366_THATH|nr:Bah domain [Thalictrum thalictroides]
MLPVPALGSTTTVVGSDSTASVTSDSFLKDGRKVSVGDCALFKPLQDTSPPFIGIIRSLTLDKEKYLKLGVNWLYRPADVKLSKGILLESAPNEIFYSFHKDEIPAASLLHPCKVAFLRKGVELPSGISSFVCRRVYDTSNKRLWWLTDQDYINERQEEVDQLLDKTRVEMHATTQSGGRSPKPVNGPTSTPQLKPSSDGVQHSTTSFSSQVKARKRDRSDPASEIIKKERSVKIDDGNAGLFKSESTLKSEIAKITDKGALVDLEGVEKIVQLMQPDRADKKIGLSGRMILADVITVTDKYECLGKFVQLKGLSVLDDWLQEVHKGKTGDGNIAKESDKVVEDFLFALLRALDKLPVDLHALQTCNVGKSVNHLRSHKNVEIQKKARGLVDTWKKRVEAEMNMNDAKSGPNQTVSWPNKTGFSEVPHGGSRRAGGSSEIPSKNSGTQLSESKSPPVKVGHGDFSSKMASSPGLGKSSPVAIPKDSPCKMPVGCSASDVPLSTIREEKSSSSSQSQNNSQSCSSDHAKPLGSSWKEDARSSTAGSLNASKTSNSAARHRKSSNGAVGSAVSGVSTERKTTFDKVPLVGSGERTVDVSTLDNGSNQRLIVRLPNLGRSPARSSNGGSLDDPSTIASRVSSPRFPEKHDHFDRRVKAKSDSYRTNTVAGVNKDSQHRSDVKDELADEGDESPDGFLYEEHDRTSDEAGKVLEALKGTCSSPGVYKGSYANDQKPGKSHEASFRSINVLIESCVKSEALPSMPIGDDRGMNLLASVAAGEMSKSEQISPLGSPGRSSSVLEDLNPVNDAKRLCTEDVAVQSQVQPDHSADGDSSKQVHVISPFQVKGAEPHGALVSLSSNLEDGGKASFVDQKPAKEHNEHFVVVERPDKVASMSVVMFSADKREEGAGIEGADSQNTHVSSRNGDGIQDLGPLPESSFNMKINNADEKIAENSISTTASDLACRSVGDACDIGNATTSVKAEKEAVGETPSCEPSETGVENKNLVHKRLGDGMLTEHKLSSALKGDVKGSTEVAELSGGYVADTKNVNARIDCVDAKTNIKQNESQKADLASSALKNVDNNTAVGVGSSVLDHDNGVDSISERKDLIEGPSLDKDSPRSPAQEDPKCVKPGIEVSQLEECVSTTEASSSSVAARPDMGAKLDFDLNEGFPVDEGDPVMSVAVGCSSVLDVHGSLSSLSPMSNGLPLVPVAAAARGPFVPPENLLRNTGGWKGSAATSAFRPAEPRKILEMPLTTSDIPPDGGCNKQGRPPLDIDLNEPDDRSQDDTLLPGQGLGLVPEVLNVHDYRRNEGLVSSHAPIRSFGGLDLDLNRVDDDTEIGQSSTGTSTARRFEVLSVRQPSSSGYSNGEVNVLRNFDLNNGPGFDEAGIEQPPARQYTKSSMPFLPSVSGIRMNGAEYGSLSSWFPPGNSYPAVAIPSILPDRGEQAYPVVSTAGGQRILGPPTGGITFGPDGYRGPVLSSSPAVAFPPGTPFSYPGFPFGTNFPLPSTSFSSGSAMYLDSSSTAGLCFPAVPSQLVGAAAASAVSSHYPRPYVISLPDGSTNGMAENSRRWVRQGLDLNAGPAGTDIEGRDERLPSASRQFSGASSQTLAEEQMRMFQAAGAGLKRKEPEGGWDTERFSYKQPSWQ